jgi:hypothetical protein
MSYNDDEELVGEVDLDDENTEDEAFIDDSPLDEDFLDDEDENDKVPEGFLDDIEE